MGKSTISKILWLFSIAFCMFTRGNLMGYGLIWRFHIPLDWGVGCRTHPFYKKVNSVAIPNSLKASASFSHCGRARTLRNLTNHYHQNPPEPHQASSPEPSGTSPGICTGSFRNLTLEDRNSAWFFHRPHGWPVANFPPARSVRRRCTWLRQANTTRAWVDRFCMICTGQTLQSLQLEGMEPFFPPAEFSRSS